MKLLPDFELRIKSIPHNPERMIRISDLKRKRTLRKKMDLIGRRVIHDMKANVSGSILKRRTGRLWRSLGFRVENIPEGYRLIMGSTKDPTIPYAKIHDTGGMAGRNHATRIPKRSYARLAVAGSKYVIRRHLRDFVAEVSR